MTQQSAFVIGATGQVGRATVRALAADGFQVRAASRGGGRDASWPAEVRAVRLDRADDAALADALGEGCDVLVDCVAYGRDEARQLLGLADRIGSAVVISSVAVYEDGQGRSLDTQNEPDGSPAYPVPIPESQPTVEPGEGTYATRKAALERELLTDGRLPATLLRAGAIHGPHSRTPRELHFVKRVVDGRRTRILAHRGESRFHPVHVANIAELVRLAARRPGSRVLNAADPQAPTVAEISAAVDAALGAPESELVLMDGAPETGPVGQTPWSAARPVVCDMSAAERELGYRPVTDYAASLPETAEGLARRLAEEPDWRAAFPEMAKAYDPHLDLFDYAAEDAWLAGHGYSVAR
ncbi:NAD(P)-dependent oxidoreductase [Streptomyces sp. XD-27]|uniref:NAD-dependent epimerase/dehydratase family protein n=1 Tax=Streptomyces sp. XD-27 TaxID=3062779 RepID=UPI0026F45D2E|nr:NAD-dependent epimerase/dehydratase family protein [Streptomyces sp. XD-27]WKX73932.1 NAD-dependent epimerase/dehydratase family protein [Streptomyces sp. XD-27]